jgi:hypothetical protein
LYLHYDDSRAISPKENRMPEVDEYEEEGEPRHRPYVPPFREPKSPRLPEDAWEIPTFEEPKGPRVPDDPWEVPVFPNTPQEPEEKPEEVFS